MQKLYAIGFSKYTVTWFQSYLSNRSFLVNLGDNFSQLTSVSCGVSLVSILGSLLLLLYVNDMSQAVKCNLFFYTDDTSLAYQNKDINKIENQLNEDFCNICDWFVDNKLNIQFDDDKTKSILFTSKFERKNILKINISDIGIYKLNNILKRST